MRARAAFLSGRPPRRKVLEPRLQIAPAGAKKENADRGMNGVSGRPRCGRGWWDRVLGTIATPFDTDHWELYDVNNHAADSLPDIGDGNDAEQSGVSQ